MMPTPQWLATKVDSIPDELAQRHQWVGWSARQHQGKWTKVPINPHTGRLAKAADGDDVPRAHETWGTFADALKRVASDRLQGIGYVFAQNDPFVGVDLDDCRDATTGDVAEWATQIVDQINSYTEVSPSGTGLKIIARGSLPGKNRKRSDVEMYDHDRFFTITGHHLEGTPCTVELRADEIAALYRDVFPEDHVSRSDPTDLPTSTSDEDVISELRSHRNGAKFDRLFSGDTSEHGDDESAADLALCSIIAFETQDRTQIDRIFRTSGLYRPKWERDDYRERTISKALTRSVVRESSPLTRDSNPFEYGDSSRDGSPVRLCAVNEFPRPIDRAAFHGLAGEIVNAIAPHTEADEVALLVLFLAEVGNIVGSSPRWYVSGRPHHTLIYPILVGDTSKGRKGTAQGSLQPILKVAAPDWVDRCNVSGLSSGEGLIWAVRDPIYKTEPIRQNRKITGYDEVLVDPGITDKRLLVVEEEYASVIKQMAREGNILSPVIRQAWDSGDLRTLTKNSPVTATGAHITIVGHVTKDELLRYLNSTESANGFANRHIWISVRRSKQLPDGGNLDHATIAHLGHQLSKTIETAKHIGTIERDEDASELWRTVYGPLSEGGVGLLGAITSRAEVQVMRLAAIYAVLDESNLVTCQHLEAALAVWDYSEASARYIFGDALGDPDADMILAALRQNGEMTQTEISNLFGRNVSATRLERALRRLLAAHKVRRTTRLHENGGRPAVVWSAV